MQAKVTGRCDNCHTMHNSQNGTAVDPHMSILSYGHGAPYPDTMRLRWNYEEHLAGGGGDDTGCFCCHTTKN